MSYAVLMAGEPIPRTQFVLSWWTLLAVASGVAAGFVLTLLTVRLRSHTRFGIRDFLASEKGDFGWLAVIDGAGAALISLTLWAISPVRSAAAIRLSHQAPGAFWVLIGLLGPLTSSGLLRLLPSSIVVTRNTSTSARSGGRNSVKLPISLLRGTIVRDIVAIATHLGNVWTRARRDWILGFATQAIGTGRMHFDAIKSTVEIHHQETKKALPSGFRSLCAERAAWVTDRDPGDATERLVTSCLEGGYEMSIAELCRLKVTKFNYSEFMSAEASVQPALLGVASVESSFVAEPEDLDSVD